MTERKEIRKIFLRDDWTCPFKVGDIVRGEKLMESLGHGYVIRPGYSTSKQTRFYFFAQGKSPGRIIELFGQHLVIVQRAARP